MQNGLTIHIPINKMFKHTDGLIGISNKAEIEYR